MANRSKARGTFHETEVVNWLHDQGWPHAKRITMKGAADEGDIELGDGIPVTIEAKRTKAFTPSTFLNELEAEMQNRGDKIGAVVAKRRGTTDVGDYYVLMPMRVFTRLLRRAGYAADRRPLRRRRSRS